jgi:predicted transcriptional regulator
MKSILIKLDDRSARDLERVAPAAQRRRAEFIRLAIRRAIDLALDRETRAAYAIEPFGSEVTAADLEGWDPANALALPARATRPPRRPRAKRAA